MKCIKRLQDSLVNGEGMQSTARNENSLTAETDLRNSGREGQVYALAT